MCQYLRRRPPVPLKKSKRQAMATRWFAVASPEGSEEEGSLYDVGVTGGAPSVTFASSPPSLSGPAPSLSGAGLGGNTGAGSGDDTGQTSPTSTPNRRGGGTDDDARTVDSDALSALLHLQKKRTMLLLPLSADIIIKQPASTMFPVEGGPRPTQSHGAPLGRPGGEATAPCTRQYSAQMNYAAVWERMLFAKGNLRPEKVLGKSLAFFLRDMCGALSVSEKSAYDNVADEEETEEESMYAFAYSRKKTSKNKRFCLSANRDACGRGEEGDEGDEDDAVDGVDGVDGVDSGGTGAARGERRRAKRAALRFERILRHEAVFPPEKLKDGKRTWEKFYIFPAPFWVREIPFDVRCARYSAENFKSLLADHFAHYMFDSYVSGEVATLLSQAEMEIVETCKNGERGKLEALKKEFFFARGIDEAPLDRALKMLQEELEEHEKTLLRLLMIQYSVDEGFGSWESASFVLLLLETPRLQDDSFNWVIGRLEKDAVDGDAPFNWQTEVEILDAAASRAAKIEELKGVYTALFAKVKELKTKVYDALAEDCGRRTSKFIEDKAWRLNLIRLVQALKEERQVNNDTLISGRAWRARHARDLKREALFFFQQFVGDGAGVNPAFLPGAFGF